MRTRKPNARRIFPILRVQTIINITQLPPQRQTLSERSAKKKEESSQHTYRSLEVKYNRWLGTRRVIAKTQGTVKSWTPQGQKTSDRPSNERSIAVRGQTIFSLRQVSVSRELERRVFIPGPAADSVQQTAVVGRTRKLETELYSQPAPPGKQGRWSVFKTKSSTLSVSTYESLSIPGQAGREPPLKKLDDVLCRERFRSRARNWRRWAAESRVRSIQEKQTKKISNKR